MFSAMLCVMSAQNIQLYLTKSHDCSYVNGETAINLVPDPNLTMNMDIYSQLIQLGYRRSGDHTYKPHCNDCSLCLSCRVPVKHFLPKKSQSRCLKRNQDLSINITPAYYSDEHFSLYSNYLLARHPDGGMANPKPEDFKNFLYCDWSNTDFIEIRLNETLIAVAVTDKVGNGLSAVYSYFSPNEKQRSLGNFCILQQIQHAKTMQYDYLYMGYWVKNCRKMEYKNNFQPMEILKDARWRKMDALD